MESWEFIVESPEDLSGPARCMKQLTDRFSVFLLDGPMGAGKTTLTKVFADEMGVIDQVSSPTFGIVNQYVCEHQTLYHFDLYRIQSHEELMNIGFDEYLAASAIVLIEWPEWALSSLHPGEIVWVRFQVQPTHRVITIETV